MNRLIVTTAAFLLSGTALRAVDPAQEMQSRVNALESKVKALEAALRELSEKIEEPSPTPISSPSPLAPTPPVVPAPTPAVATTKPYTIVEGDTISVIAQKHNIPRQELMEVNGFREGQQIYIGDTIKVPQSKSTSVAKTPTTPAQKPAAPTTTTTVSNTTAASSYKVKAGDTLSKIARAHGTTVSAIKSTNKLSTDSLSIGQSLKIPGKTGSSVAGTSTSTPATNVSASGNSVTKNVSNLLRPEETYGVYTVENGDTLYSLARDFFTTQTELQRLNELGASTTLRPGKDIVVPTKKYTEHHSKVAKND